VRLSVSWPEAPPGTPARLMARYLLPNIAGSLIVLTSVYLSQAILTEAALSFLGDGLRDILDPRLHEA
jgi:ABC-type dipeptide/oligopeptide/nickel transport system permease subunit